MMIAKLFRGEPRRLGRRRVAQPAAAGFVEQHAEHAYADSLRQSRDPQPCRLQTHRGWPGTSCRSAGGPRASPRVVYLDDEMYRVRNV